MGRPPLKKMQRQEGEGNDVVEKKPEANYSALTCSSTHYVVGSWARPAQHDQAIVIKIFFKKSLMAWEIFMEDGVKRKMETPFSNILALKRVNNNFQIMLNVAPKFFRDTNVDPTKYPKWDGCGDFTDSQASFRLLHTFTCYSEKLEKFHKKIFATCSVVTSLFNCPYPLEKDPSQTPSEYPLDHPDLSQASPLDHLSSSPVLEPILPRIETTIYDKNCMSSLKRDSFQNDQDLDMEIFEAMPWLKGDSFQDDPDLIRGIFEVNEKRFASLLNNFETK